MNLFSPWTDSLVPVSSRWLGTRFYGPDSWVLWIIFLYQLKNKVLSARNSFLHTYLLFTYLCSSLYNPLTMEDLVFLGSLDFRKSLKLWFLSSREKIFFWQVNWGEVIGWHQLTDWRSGRCMVVKVSTFSFKFLWDY